LYSLGSIYLLHYEKAGGCNEVRRVFLMYICPAERIFFAGFFLLRLFEFTNYCKLKRSV